MKNVEIAQAQQYQAELLGRVADRRGDSPAPRNRPTRHHISGALPPEQSLGLRLDATHLPHITLAQAFVELEELDRVASEVETAIRDTAIEPGDHGAARSHSSVSLSISKTKELLTLHERVMRALHGLERTGGGVETFAEGDGRQRDVEWVANFRAASSFERFSPHVTLGHAEQPPAVSPAAFTATTIALCRLGRFCSCRRVLRQWTLPED